jgi:hypothetical protein
MKDQIIDYLVNEGVEITISKDMEPDGYGVYYDLNTAMKSHAHLVFSADRFKIYKRYGGVCTSPIFTDQYIEIEDVIDFICWEVKDCICGRDFMSERWEKLLIKRNILKKNVKTTTTVTYE